MHRGEGRRNNEVVTVRSIAHFRVRPGHAEAFERAYRGGQFLERATTNAGFIAGELVRSVDDPDLFIAVAEWKTIGDYRAWQAGYDDLPADHAAAMHETLAEPVHSVLAQALLTADRTTPIGPDEA